MLLLASQILFAAVANALPSRIISRQDLVDVGGFKINAANRIIPVVVGGAQDTFVPNTVTAAVGDIIQFQFSNGNHTVTQSAQDKPCQPLQATVATAIHSGHIPFQDGQTTVGTFNMPVTNADTMFLYCATGPHCQLGQVMVVNPKDDQQIVNYAKGAASTNSSVDGGAVSGGSVASIPLAAAAFVPAPAQQGPPGGAAPAAEAPAATAAPASSKTAASKAAVTPSEETITITAKAGATITLPLLGAAAAAGGTTTTTITVPAAKATAAPAAA
ncbi:uncharacterized protein GGS22DRAFT_191435 [Annulohypoxylon maeteangense]|uniref:uncharacterized protein n=1 Tax=Annulohypoxylon maeteangense TaxID=1927788 RepID=UPI00200782B0|nr:uncharacterized protein GGS22DRAFT_191435 [Annulohypoxylon maeteangense]KAI0882266.1 hypothetical protein GGS22DRAFT_191435 [Annulohypoxylon maeteangense]